MLCFRFDRASTKKASWWKRRYPSKKSSRYKISLGNQHSFQVTSHQILISGKYLEHWYLMYPKFRSFCLQCLHHAFAFWPLDNDTSCTLTKIQDVGHSDPLIAHTYAFLIMYVNITHTNIFLELLFIYGRRKIFNEPWTLSFCQKYAITHIVCTYCSGE